MTKNKLIIDTRGNYNWYIEDTINEEGKVCGIYHREDGPAFIGEGGKEWLQYGKTHRRDGPAIEWADGREAWYWKGTLCRSLNEWFDICDLSIEEKALIKLRYV